MTPQNLQRWWVVPLVSTICRAVYLVDCLGWRLAGKAFSIRHYSLRFSHASQLTLNWTSEAFHNVSQLAVNTTVYQVRGFAQPCLSIWSKKWTYLGPVTQHFCQWTWSCIIHGHHMSHPMNLRLYWYGICVSCRLSWCYIKFCLSIHSHCNNSQLWIFNLWTWTAFWDLDSPSTPSFQRLSLLWRTITPTAPPSLPISLAYHLTPELH